MIWRHLFSKYCVGSISSCSSSSFAAVSFLAVAVAVDVEEVWGAAVLAGLAAAFKRRLYSLLEMGSPVSGSVRSGFLCSCACWCGGEVGADIVCVVWFVWWWWWVLRVHPFLFGSCAGWQTYLYYSP